MMTSENRDHIAGNILIKMEVVVEHLLEKFKVEINGLVSEIKEEIFMDQRFELQHIGIRVDEIAQKAISNLKKRL